MNASYFLQTVWNVSLIPGNHCHHLFVHHTVSEPSNWNQASNLISIYLLLHHYLLWIYVTLRRTNRLQINKLPWFNKCVTSGLSLIPACVIKPNLVYLGFSHQADCCVRLSPTRLHLLWVTPWKPSAPHFKDHFRPVHLQTAPFCNSSINNILCCFL